MKIEQRELINVKKPHNIYGSETRRLMGIEKDRRLRQDEKGLKPRLKESIQIT